MEFLTTYFVSIPRYCIEVQSLLARVGQGSTTRSMLLAKALARSDDGPRV